LVGPQNTLLDMNKWQKILAIVLVCGGCLGVLGWHSKQKARRFVAELLNLPAERIVHVTRKGGIGHVDFYVTVEINREEHAGVMRKLGLTEAGNAKDVERIREQLRAYLAKLQVQLNDPIGYEGVLENTSGRFVYALSDGDYIYWVICRF